MILAAAFLYASVGHAGASGYLAAMALMGLPAAQMRPSALLLNILVATIATISFARAGWFSWRLFWPFAVISVPMAFVGGGLTLPGRSYKVAVGAVLLFAAARLLAGKLPERGTAPAPLPSLLLALVAGAGIGFLSGLTGVGGGIFLSPLLLFLGWAGMRETAGVSAAFILVNSVAGLIGAAPQLSALPAGLPLWAAAALLGGWAGAYYGSRRLAPGGLRKVLGVVLIVAGLKMMLV
jgi:uncharacterized membrane protein YfcA